jgi:hypothetical protein
VNDAPPQRIIHVKNWHWIPKAPFAIDQRVLEPDLTEEQIDVRYGRFLDDIEELQKEQAELIRQLARQYGLRSAFYEGITPDNLQAFQAANNRLKLTHRLQDKMKSYEETTETIEIRRNLDQLAKDLREDRIQLGAIGSLIRDGDLDDVIPLESTEMLEAANPITQDGQIRSDSVAGTAREAEMVRRILAGGPVAIVVLGGAHDLSDALKKASPSASYETRETPKYQQLAK